MRLNKDLDRVEFRISTRPGIDSKIQVNDLLKIIIPSQTKEILNFQRKFKNINNEESS